MKTLLAWILIITSSASIGQVMTKSGPRIQVNAILNDAAVLTINGSQQMLRKNAISREGYKLVNIGSDKVTLLISGELKDYKLGATIGSSRSSNNQRNIQISRDNKGMYFSSGTINNYPVNFLVDTGATFVAINSNLAKKIGLDYKRNGKQGLANTASGMVKVWNLKLDNVSLGSIELQFVDAAVIEGKFPVSPLLGMSFLSRVTIQDDGMLLTIGEKY